MEMTDNMSDEENDCQTSDYFSESTPKSVKSICLDHKYALSPTYSVTTCLSTSSDTSSTLNINCEINTKLIKKQKSFKGRRLFDKEEEPNKRGFNLTPLSERQQLAIALQLSSVDCSSHNTYNTNNALTDTPLKSSTQRVKRNHKGETGLHTAAIKGDINKVKQILSHNKYPVDCPDFAGWTPIHEACNRGHIAIVEALLEAGSDVNARGYNNDTPLIDAAVNGHYNLVELLLRYGADYTLTNNCNKNAVEVTKSVRVIEVIHSFIEEKMRKNSVNTKDNVNKSRSSSPSNNNPVKPSSPRLTLRFQSIKDTKQTTGSTISTVSGPTMSSTKSYSVSTASDKELIESIDKQNENKTNTSNGSTSELVSASSDHNYTSVDSSLTTSADESNRSRKRRKSNEGSISSTGTASSGPSPRSGSASSNTSNQSSNYNNTTLSGNKKHHNQNPHHSHHTNKSKDCKEKTGKKSMGSSMSSSDSDGIENTECDKESNPKDSTSNGTSIVGSTEANAPKVPPLRIVLPANTSITTSSLNASTASNSGPHSSLASNVTSSTSSSGAKFPYVVSSEESFHSESENVSGAVSSQRITRSSQRVAQQQSQKSSNSVEHHSDSEESALHSSQTDSQHPRKRKIRNNNNTNDKSVANHSNNASNGDNDNDSSSSASSVHLIPKDVSPFALPQTNCYQMFLSIRKNVDKKRREMFSVPPKAPQGFDDYLINRCSYMLANKDLNNDGPTTLAKPSMGVPPTTLTGSRMNDIFVGQEKERYKLKVQHLIEKQKLKLSSEQEILRVHGRAARAMANQSVPFSVCSILKDEEIYNVFDSESDQNDNISNQIKSEKGLTAGTSGLSANRTRYNGRLFCSWLQDVSDKWEKTKKVMLLRHRKESESLFAMQRLEWEWKLKEFGLCDLKTSPNIDDKHVPKVYVSDCFELSV